jgi:hypothetical protein
VVIFGSRSQGVLAYLRENEATHDELRPIQEEKGPFAKRSGLFEGKSDHLQRIAVYSKGKEATIYNTKKQSLKQPIPVLAFY